MEGSKLTKYENIAIDMKEKIEAGVYKPNEQLPFESEMCEFYGVSRITVKKAMDLLVSQGLIVKRRGAGTFVKNITLPQKKRTFSIRFQSICRFCQYGRTQECYLCYP